MGYCGRTKVADLSFELLNRGRRRNELTILDCNPLPVMLSTMLGKPLRVSTHGWIMGTVAYLRRRRIQSPCEFVQAKMIRMKGSAVARQGLR